MYGSGSLADQVVSISVIPKRCESLTNVQIVFLGDTSFIESYQQQREQKGEENILRTREYAYFFANVAEFLSDANFVLANLETPVTDIDVSPFAGQKSYIHKADLVNTPAQLSRHGIQAVSLANNHSFDYGTGGLIQTFSVLREHTLTYLGAGENTADAEKPLLLEIKAAENSLAVAIFAAYDAPARFRKTRRVEVGEPALCVLEPARIAQQITALRGVHPRLLSVAFPHWGSNYRWRTQRQQRLAESLLEAGIDLIIGHGAHMIQEVDYQAPRWIVYGIGNFVFNSPGRYSRYNAPPISFVVRLIITLKANSWQICLRLYPILTYNRLTD